MFALGNGLQFGAVTAPDIAKAKATATSAIGASAAQDGVRTGKWLGVFIASTLTISVGTIARPHGDDAPPASVYQGCASVMRASFWAKENG